MRALRSAAPALLRASLPLLAAVAVSAPALAQQAGPLPGRGGPPPATLTIDLGAAPVLTPAWQGSRDYGLSIFPDLRLNYRNVVTFSIPEGLAWTAIDRDGWKAGPIVRLRFGRNEDNGSPFLITGGSNALRGMGDIGVAGEFGGFAQYTLPGTGISLRGELRKGAGAHKAVVGDVRAGYFARKGRLVWSAGARATFATASYSQRYFGVNLRQSAATGLAVSRPDGGLISYGVNGNMVRRLNDRLSLTAFGGYERLADTVAKTSLIRQRGDADQFTAGLGFSYRFRVR